MNKYEPANYQKNKNKFKTYAKKYYNNNKNKCNEYSKQYYNKNKEKIKKLHRKYNIEHAGFIREYHRLRHLGVKLTKKEYYTNSNNHIINRKTKGLKIKRNVIVYFS